MPRLFPSIVFLLFLSQISNPTHAQDPHTIKFQSPGLYPKSLTWDPSSQHFIIASLHRSTFHSVSDASVFETLTLIPTSAFPENATILSLAVDSRRHRLLAGINTPLPHLASFDLTRSSLRLLFLSPLPTSSSDDAAADVTVDPAGNAYVTNSGGNVIWKVDVDGKSTVLSKSQIFSPHGVNAVVYIPTKEYLLAVQSKTGKMFKVDAIDGTARHVDLLEELTSANGIAVRQDGVVLVVSKNSLWFLKSDDSWGRGGVIDKIALDKEGLATSVTVGGGGRVYVIYGYAEEGKMGNVEEEREWVRIEEIRSKRENEGETVWPFVLIGLGFAYVIFWRFQMTQLVGKMDKKTN